MERENQTETGKEEERELFRESIWRRASSYEGIMFSVLFC